MKKLYAVIVAGLMLLAAGCSSATPTPTVAPTSAPTTAPASTVAATATVASEATPTVEATVEPTATPAVLEPLGLQDLMLVVDGEFYDLQSDVGTLLDTLGDQYEKKAVSGGFSGESETEYVYEGIKIRTYPADDIDVMYSAEFTSDLFDTARGMHVGSTADEVKAAFGAGFYEEGGAIIYTFDGKKKSEQSSSITFNMKDGAVSSVILYNAGDVQ